MCNWVLDTKACEWTCVIHNFERVYCYERHRIPWHIDGEKVGFFCHAANRSFLYWDRVNSEQ